MEIRYNNGRARRGVAQFGRVLGLGPRCRRFKSCRLDQKNLVKLLTMDQKPAIINRLSPQYAGVAQLVEQLICNQQVGGSSPSTSSTKLKISYGRVPEWPKGADCKSVVSDFGGPNPPSPTRLSLARCRSSCLKIFLSSKTIRLKASEIAPPPCAGELHPIIKRTPEPIWLGGIFVLD